jgi:hypothetical protein
MWFARKFDDTYGKTNFKWEKNVKNLPLGPTPKNQERKKEKKPRKKEMYYFTKKMFVVVAHSLFLINFRFLLLLYGSAS